MLPVPSEREVLRQCLQYLNLVGIPCWRSNSGAVTGEYKGKKRFVRFNGAKGCADIIGIAPGGTFLAIECKRPGKEPTEDQAAFLDMVRRNGGVALCVHSLEELQAALAELKAT